MSQVTQVTDEFRVVPECYRLQRRVQVRKRNIWDRIWNRPLPDWENLLVHSSKEQMERTLRNWGAVAKWEDGS